jgi:SAM-dependent methyltransferase
VRSRATGPYNLPIATDDQTRPEVAVTDVPRHRYTVGMRTGYDTMSGVQFSVLFALGMRETHKVCDVGCGSLRVGRLLIPYLARGNYYGIEPRAEVLEEGIDLEIGRQILTMREPHFDTGEDFGLHRFDTKFDYVLAQSVFSHTYRDLTETGIAAIAAALAPGGLFVGTFIEEFPILMPRGVNHGPDQGSGFWHQGGVTYTWREWKAVLAQHGLVVRRIRWFHLRQTWFVAARAGDDAHLKTAVHGMTNRLRGPGVFGHAKRRALARLRRG